MDTGHSEKLSSFVILDGVHIPLQPTVRRDMFLGPQAVAAAEGLLELMQQLEDSLNEPSNFNGEVNWEGRLVDMAW